MKGAPLEDIADLLGHKSLTMTRRYAHLGPDKLHALVSQQVTPQVAQAQIMFQVMFQVMSRKLLCSNHFRGVAQW
jgi:hypothetical protein